jgi:hypothetical protein
MLRTKRHVLLASHASTSRKWLGRRRLPRADQAETGCSTVGLVEFFGPDRIGKVESLHGEARAGRLLVLPNRTDGRWPSLVRKSGQPDTVSRMARDRSLSSLVALRREAS